MWGFEFPLRTALRVWVFKTQSARQGATGEDVPSALAAAMGIRQVLDGERSSFELAYPCHGPGVERWFRIPQGLYEELVAIRTDSDYVFAAYGEQVRRFHVRQNRPQNAWHIRNEFNPR